MGTEAPQGAYSSPFTPKRSFAAATEAGRQLEPMPVGSLVFFCWKRQCQHLLPMPGGQRGMWGGSRCCWPTVFPPAQIQGWLQACHGGRGFGGMGVRLRDPKGAWGALAEAGRALAGGRKPGGGRGAVQLAGSRCQVSHLSLQGAKCRESHCGRASRSHPLRQGDEGSRRCQAAEGEAGAGGRPWTGGTAAVPAGHPDVLGGHPQDVSARQGGHGKQTWASRAREGAPRPL